MKQLIFIILITTQICRVLCAQTPVDTVEILSLDEFVQLIQENHPASKRSALLVDDADAQRLRARGLIDPKFTAGLDQKSYSDKLYYQDIGAMVRVPTILGIDVVGGYEFSRGEFVNPEDVTGQYGLWNLGAEINLLQGLLINERRIERDKADVQQDIALSQQSILMNDILMESSTYYLLWWKYHQIIGIYREALALSEAYSEFTRETFALGEKTAMDTLEASVAVQDAQNKVISAEGYLIKYNELLENYLFSDRWIELNGRVPQSDLSLSDDMNAIVNIEQVLADHPILVEKRNQINQYELDQRWKREKLKPKLKLKYNPLLARNQNNAIPQYDIDDFKWGVDFQLPIRNRYQRGEVEIGEIKIDNAELELLEKERAIENKIQNALQQIEVLDEQIAVQEVNNESYRRLMEGEMEKFRYGESSVFLINKRQEKYIDGRIKLIELKAKRNQAVIEARYWTNTMIEQ